MNLYILLHQDHDKARNLFEQLDVSGEDETDRRERLFATLNRELSLHSEAEERFFYSRLKSNDESRETAAEALGDHKGMKRLLTELEAMDVGTPEWTAKCRELRDECEAHILLEEGELFAQAQRILGDEEAAGIAEDIQAFKEEHAEIEIG
jgi:iron-sulfur cluster repair protein YtfE (RIC family)